MNFFITNNVHISNSSSDELTNYAKISMKSINFNITQTIMHLWVISGYVLALSYVKNLRTTDLRWNGNTKFFHGEVVEQVVQSSLITLSLVVYFQSETVT